MHVFRIIIVGHYPRPITLTRILTELWPFLNLENSWFCLQLQTSKTTEDIQLKFNACLQDFNWRSLSKALNSDMDFDRIMALCELHG